MAQSAEPAWKTVKDPSGACQISIPPNWSVKDLNSGTALFKDAKTAVAVVTSVTGRPFAQLSESVRKQIGPDKVYENTEGRVFYADQIAKTSNSMTGINVRVPLEGGICSSRVMFIPAVPEDVAKKIALSVSPAR